MTEGKELADASLGGQGFKWRFCESQNDRCPPPSLSRIYAYVYRIKGTIPLKDNGFSSFSPVFRRGKCGERVQEFSWSEWDNMRQIGISFPLLFDAKMRASIQMLNSGSVWLDASSFYSPFFRSKD